MDRLEAFTLRHAIPHPQTHQEEKHHHHVHSPWLATLLGEPGVAHEMGPGGIDKDA
jgi:hypothetical protein